MTFLGSVLRGYEAILDAVLPPRERVRRTKALALEDLPLSPTAHELLGVRITTLMEYRTAAVRDLVQSLKYDGASAAAHLAASVLAEYLHEELSAQRSFSTTRVLLVPVPLHGTRMRERGFNQIGLVLEALPAEYRDGTRAALAPELIERVRPTKPQTHFSRQERLSNVAGAFAARQPHLARDAHVILIDDVATTGATLANAATPLRRAGASVTLLALARA